MRLHLPLTFLAATALLLACSGDADDGGVHAVDDAGDASPAPDAGSIDAATPDAATQGDSGEDAGFDATTQVDSGEDAGPDADAPADAGRDAEASSDAGTDAPLDVDGGPADADVDAPIDASPDAGPPCPTCLVLATAVNPTALVADAKNVYWMDEDGDTGTVKKVPIGGLPDGGAPAILADHQALRGGQATNEYRGMAVDATSIYWTTASYIVEAPIDGSAAARILGGSNAPNAIAVDATTIYWTDDDTLDAPFGSVSMMPKGGFTDGGLPTALVKNAGDTGGIAVDATSIYWTQWPSTILTVPLHGGTPSTIASGQQGPTGIAVGASQVFWTEASDGYPGLLSAPLSGVPDGGSPAALSTSYAGPSVVTDTSNVYWYGGGQILEAPLSGVADGGAPKVLASNQIGVWCIALDPSPTGNVYWSAQPPAGGSGYRIMQAPK